MKHHMLALASLAQKQERTIIGLMSGTSLDGLDIALCRFKGAGMDTRVEVLKFETVPYDADFKTEIRKVFAKKEIDFQHLTLLNVVIAQHHAILINACLKQWGIPASNVDLLASHGQTVFHAPRVLHGLSGYPNATLQIGDGDHLARSTGIITVSDFRQKHLAAGGEGAPLALYGDYFLFTEPGETRFLLNIGGIANFTYLPASGSPSEAFATDTGPGNTLLDAFARAQFGVPFDENAMLAKAGRVDEWLLTALKSESFFHKPFPKTTGPELFSWQWVDQILLSYPKGKPNPYDLMATLTQLTVDTIAEALLQTVDQLKPQGELKLFLSGGGAHNPLIVQCLTQKLPEWYIQPMKTLGVDGDAKEAVLFAVLANETVAGATTKGSMLGGIPMVGMGKISLPD